MQFYGIARLNQTYVSANCEVSGKKRNSNARPNYSTQNRCILCGLTIIRKGASHVKISERTIATHKQRHSATLKQEGMWKEMKVVLNTCTHSISTL